MLLRTEGDMQYFEALLKEIRSQVDKLTTEVSQLTTEVNRLTTEVTLSSIIKAPKDDRWEWWVETVPPNTVLKPGESKITIRDIEDGWVWYGILAFSSKDMGFILKLQTVNGKILENDYTVSDLISYGLDVPTQGWWISNEDDSTPLYVVVYTPYAFPGTPFHRLSFWVKNASKTMPGVVYGGAIVLIKVRD